MPLSTRSQSFLVLVAVVAGFSCLIATVLTPAITETVWTKPSILSSSDKPVKCIGSQPIFSATREFLFCEDSDTMAPQTTVPELIVPDNLAKFALAWLLTVVALVQTIYMSARARGSASVRKVCSAFLLIAGGLCFLLLMANIANFKNLENVEKQAIQSIKEDAPKTATPSDLKQLVQTARESGTVPTYGIGVGLYLIMTASVLLCAGGTGMLISAAKCVEDALALPTTAGPKPV